MRSYNGHTGEARLKAYYWFKREIAAGRKPPAPPECKACGQTEGALMWHSENYSKPYGPHIGEHGLCYRCHMMVHLRFRHPEAWAIYKALIREGWVFHPTGRSFGTVIRENISMRGVGVKHAKRPPPGKTWLDTLP